MHEQENARVKRSDWADRKSSSFEMLDGTYVVLSLPDVLQSSRMRVKEMTHSFDITKKG